MIVLMLVVYRSVQGIILLPYENYTCMETLWEGVWRTWCKSHLNPLQDVTRIKACLCAQIVKPDSHGFLLRKGRK